MTREEAIDKVLDELQKDFLNVNLPLMAKLTLFAKVQNAVRYVADLPTVEPQEWIPVKERLPEKTSKYLVTVGINFFGFGMNDEVSVAIYNIKDGWFCAEENKDTIIGDVVAWKPLPSPYKGQ